MTPTSPDNLVENYMALFEDAIAMSKYDPIEGAMIFKFLYSQAERIKKWEFIDDKDRLNIQTIMDDLKRRIEEL